MFHSEDSVNNKLVKRENLSSRIDLQTHTSSAPNNSVTFLPQDQCIFTKFAVDSSAIFFHHTQTYIQSDITSLITPSHDLTTTIMGQ